MRNSSRMQKQTDNKRPLDSRFRGNDKNDYFRFAGKFVSPANNAFAGKTSCVFKRS
jgi:hypothetical protein